ncbi:MAG: outer membrane beta-barrel protein, partial [Proteobacteria bacterium]|nr:outer membrane beta-barrel protein [Pseudomonadota bacterium]
GFTRLSRLTNKLVWLRILIGCLSLSISIESIQNRYDLIVQSIFRQSPYVGAGVGWAEHEADTRRVNVATGAVTSLETTTDNFIWSLMLGVTYAMTDNWNIDVGYRYADLGDVEIGPFTDGGKVDSEYTSHDLTVGVNYVF